VVPFLKKWDLRTKCLTKWRHYSSIISYFSHYYIFLFLDHLSVLKKVITLSPFLFSTFISQCIANWFYHLQFFGKDHLSPFVLRIHRIFVKSVFLAVSDKLFICIFLSIRIIFKLQMRCKLLQVLPSFSSSHSSFSFFSLVYILFGYFGLGVCGLCVYMSCPFSYCFAVYVEYISDSYLLLMIWIAIIGMNYRCGVFPIKLTIGLVRLHYFFSSLSSLMVFFRLYDFISFNFLTCNSITVVITLLVRGVIRIKVETIYLSCEHSRCSCNISQYHYLSTKHRIRALFSQLHLLTMCLYLNLLC
jgi:hypothetical protein